MANKDGGSGSLSPHVIWASVVIIMTIAGTTAYVATTDLPQERYLSLFATVVAPVLATVFVMFKTGKIGKQIENVEQKTDKIEQQTNGALTAQINAVKAELHGVTELLKSVVDEHKKEGE